MGVQPGRLKQILMLPLLYETAVLEYENAVRVRHRGQPVGGRDNRAATVQAAERVDDGRLA